ncbi:hypothetical protein N7520_009582 [Penicillium odoratum]|uniref:uncharacterized protein n=1 Tax=Penicillium odoratum TaxID=1167516 RepID=UPI0025497BAC|nr:uncharacterized protein N7520_009582 [Penicillium odoratum]KAJ5752665.1 hypothetical protein N7520_009582 [Penicillium odoratum]
MNARLFSEKINLIQFYNRHHDEINQQRINFSGFTTTTLQAWFSNCDAFYEVVADDSCYNIANDHGVLLSNLYAWNTAINTDCSGLQANDLTNVPDDTCFDIAYEYGISTSSFYAWNPAVKTDCSGMQADEYVCVAVRLTAHALS